MSPTVSAVIANYRQSQFLPQAVESALAQGVDIELIVLDDASDDGSRGVVERLAAKHPEIVPLYNDVNLGISKTHNRGVDAARGEFIAFLPADDFWYPGKLGHQIEMLDGERALVGTYADSDVVTLDGKPTGETWSTLHPGPPGVNERNLASRLLNGMFVSGNTGIYRRAMASSLRFDETLTLYNDWLFWISMALSGPVRGESVSRAAYRTSASTFRRPPVVQARDQIRLLEILAPQEARFDPADFDNLVAGAVLGHAMMGETVEAFRKLLRSRPPVRERLIKSRFPLRLMLSWLRFQDTTLLSYWNAKMSPR